jgi:hypothetical protein
MLPDLDESELKCERDISFVDDYINEQTNLDRICNKTKSTKIMEFEGVYVLPILPDKVIIKLPCDDGQYYDYKNQYLYATVQDGLLTSINDISFFHYDPYEGRFLVRDNYIMQLNNNSSEVLLHDVNGSLISKYVISNQNAHPICLFADGSSIFTTYGPHNNICEHGPDGRKKWELEVGYLYVHPTIYKGYIYLHHKSSKINKSEILKINRSGSIEAK